MHTDEVYVIIAYGEKYITQAENLVKSIMKFDTLRKFILISNISHHNLFHEIINLDHEITNESNAFNKYCIKPRIIASKYIKYNKFVMLDSDMLCLTSPEYMWNIFKNNDNCFNCIGGRDGSTWHWNTIDSVNQCNNMNMKPMHAGITFFNKASDSYSKYYEDLLYAYTNYDLLNFKRKFRNNSMTEEIMFAYANDKNNIIPFDFILYPVVSFNLSDSYSPEDFIISWDTPDSTCKTTGPTIFNHFTGYNEGNNAILYQKWLDKLQI